MSYKVAVASSDGKVINQHFGRARQFLIFDLPGDGQFNFLELRENIPPCVSGEHHDDGLKKSAELLADCKIVLVSQIGPGAQQELRSRGVEAYAVSGFIDETLSKLISFEERKNLKNK